MTRLVVFSAFLFVPFAVACSSGDDDGGAGGTAGSGGAAGSGGCTGRTLTAGSFELVHDGVTYGYTVHLPPSYTGQERTPLVVNWHGLTSNAAQQEFFSKMSPVADESGFVVVYPNSPDKSWNAGTCCANNAKTRDDVGFARALVAEISAKGCIDPKRIYATGMSNGGFMSHRLACEAADLFAAVAPVAGKVGVPECAPVRPVPVLHFHGTADPLVSYSTPFLSGEGLNVPDTLARWAERDECTQRPTESYKNGTVTCQTWSGCKAGATVRLCTAEGEGHCWPGQSVCPYGAATTDIDASREMAKFFAKFALP